MKKWLVVPTLLCILLVGGCIPTTAQIQTATDMTSDLMVVVDSLQDTVGVLVKDGIIEAETVGSILIEIDEAQEDIIAVNDAVKKKADQGTLEVVKEGWEVTKDFNPYYVYGLVAINVLEALGIWNEKKKVTGLKKGISRVTGEADKEVAKNIYDTIKPYAKGLMGNSVM